MNDKTTRIIDKIRKLQAYSGNGRTAEEQASFAAAVQRLMIEYKIEEWQLAGQAGAPRVEEPIGRDVYNLHEYSERQDFLAMLLHTIATAHCCTCAMVGAREDVWVFGTTTDRAIVQYMFNFLRVAVTRCAEVAKREIKASGGSVPRGTFLESFRVGFLQTIKRRYEAERASTIAHEDENPLAVVVVTRDLVRSKDAVREALGEPSEAVEKVATATHYKGYAAGAKAASSLPLHMQGISSGSQGAHGAIDRKTINALPEASS